MKKRIDLYNSFEDEWYTLEDMRRGAYGIEKIMNGTYTQKDVSRYTVSVVPELENAGII